jgi:hypothetical protein
MLVNTNQAITLQQIAAYYETPLRDTVFMELRLRPGANQPPRAH